MKKSVCFVFMVFVSVFAFGQTINYDFESEDLSDWSQFPVDTWTVVDVDPLEGNKSLKHAPASGTGADRISVELPQWDSAEGTVIWQFMLNHKWNPSSSNFWAVYLSSNNDAEGMISDALPNGYVVGVNLTGSDDLLKLYRADGGVYTPILTTSINWQSDVTTNGTGIVIVERSPNGTFSVKVSPNGSLGNMLDQGTAVDLTYSIGGYFGVYYQYTTSAAGLLQVDDVSFSYKPTNYNDHDALASEPSQQIDGDVISSLAATPQQASDILRFTIYDQGTSDNLPTLVTRLRFSKVEGPNAANLPETIGGIKLSGSASGQINLNQIFVFDTYIDVIVDSGELVIADGEQEEFTLSLYLNPDSIADGATIQLQISNYDHGWEAHHNGSAFADVFPSIISSNLFTIQIIPTHLKVMEYPNPLVVNSPFNVVAYATDSEGNLAKSYNGDNIQLSVALGEGILSTNENLLSNAVDGIVAWENITYSKREELVLRVSNSELIEGESQSISVINDTVSTVVDPVEQVEGRQISSTSSTLGKAVEVFRFGIADMFNYDQVPTYVRQVSIKRPSGENMASFSATVGGVILKYNGNIIPTGNPHILSSSITIPVPSDALVIPDGDTLEISLWVYLREASTIVDGSTLQFMVGSANHNFIAEDKGSTFPIELGTEIVSSPFTLDVKATRLVFSNVPKAVGLNESFSVEVSAVDKGGSLDVNATGNVTLAKNLGDGWLSIPAATVPLTDGKATWSNLAYTYFTPEPFNLLARSGAYNDVLSPLIFCADQTTTIVQPVNPIVDGEIRSVAVNKEDAVEVMRFGIADIGNTDNLPTRVTKMVFRSQEKTTDANLNRIIGGAVLYVDEEEIVPQSTTIDSESITLTFAEDRFVIPDGSSVEVSLGIYLKPGGLVEGSTISLHIPASSHGWDAAPTGSGFPTTLDMGIVGPTMKIVVDGSSLLFHNQPFITEQNNPFAITAALADLFGNIDMDASGEVFLAKDFGPGEISAQSFSSSLVDGFAHWDDITLNDVGRYGFKVTIQDEGVTNAFSQPIWNGVEITSRIDEDFERTPVSINLTSQWSISTISPIDGSKSLKHGLAGVEGQSQLAIPLSIDNLGDGPVEWSFAMRNGDWDPSPDNNFWFVLASNNESLDMGLFSGYAVGVNFDGSDDLLTLWRVNGEQGSEMLIQSDFDWNEGETVSVKVTRTPGGEWNLWYQADTDQSMRLAGYAVDAAHIRVASCGPVFNYSASRAGEFWLDNLRVSEATYPPTIQSARLLNLTSVDVVFSSAVSQNDALIKSNYTLSDHQQNEYNVLEVYSNPDNVNQFTLRTDLLPFAPLMLRVEGVKSALGTTEVRDSIQLGLGAAGTFGNIVINEIMARPSADGGLPNIEYVELYNRTDKPISLSEWKFKGNNHYSDIPDAAIEPDGFIILASTNGAPVMSQYGTSLGVPSFPTLLVGGMFLGLYDNGNNLISWVEYSDEWYKDEEKKTGGFSLERIDSDNLVEGAENWIASSDPSGGTPGRENSVKESNPDKKNPWVTEIKVISETEIGIGFSEPMDSLSITLADMYSVDKGVGSPLWAKTFGPKYTWVSLSFENPIVSGEIYDLCFNEALVDFSGNPIETRCLPFALPLEPSPQDIVVNEILFNPYSGGVDFVEIFNRSEKAVDLSTLWIANGDDATQLVEDYYRASEISWLLLPNSYAVLTTDAKLIEQFYYIENPEAMVEIPNLPSYANDGGYMLLLSDTGEEIDAFAYTNDMHNPLLADTKGVSLERIHPDMPTNQSSSWQSAAQTAGFATPTAQNSQFTEPTDAKDEFSLSSKVFSPDGDGYEDYVMISYELPESGYVANIMAFDSRGRRVKRLAANVTLGTSGSIKWDGTTDGGERATVGAYVIFIEAFDLRGDIKRFKKTVVVATRFR